MKKILLSFVLFVGICGFSQTQMHIYEKNGNVTKIPVDQIDRITFHEGAPAATGNTVSDIDGNVYPVVKIGEQYWMGENLRVTKLRDGTPIQNVTSDDVWKSLEVPGYSWYSNDISNKNQFGALYNWHNVKTNKICPAGWHVPTRNEFEKLRDFLGGRAEAGGKMKEAGSGNWFPPNTGATNSVGFSGLPAGFRDLHGKFRDTGRITHFWSSTPYRGWDSFAYQLQYNTKEMISTNNGANIHGFSIRCVKD